MKIVADKQIPFAKEAFAQFGNVSLVHGREINNALLHDTDILLIRSITKVNEELLKNTPVQFIGTATSGFDHIDEAFLQKKNIAYSYAPGSNARSVAEYIISALFVLFEKETDRFREKTVGIIGYGHVGSKVSRFLQALGMKCLVNDPPLEETSHSDLFVPLEEVLRADIITLHTPLTFNNKHATHHLISDNEFAKMKQGVIFINAARGSVVDEKALLVAIHEKSLKTIIDVWQGEPQVNLELAKAVDIATPHIAGYSTDGKLRATEMLYQVACHYFQQAPVWESKTALSGSSSITTLPDTFKDKEELIKQLVLASYDVRDDHETFLNLLKLDTQEQSTHFDGLRKNYPVRREFMNTRYDMNQIDPALKEILETLGFCSVPEQ